MAVAEAITNLLAAPIELPRVKLSRQLDGRLWRTRRRRRAVRNREGRGHGAVPALGVSIPVGKDSLSMRTQWSEGSDKKKVTSPVSLIVSAFASLSDVRGTLTPQLMPPRPTPRWC